MNLESFFQLKERGTDVRTEVFAGLTTFMTMAYIIFVNPQILSNAGLPVSATMSATCLAAGIMCIAMGIFTNFPITMAAGMGLNAAVAFQLVIGSGLTYQSAMGIIVMEGVLITLLVLTGFRQAVMNAIPVELKKAIGAGIGLFIAFIGFQEAGFIVKNDATMVSLGSFNTWAVLVTVIGFFFTAALLARKIHGALLYGILGTTALSIVINFLTGGTAFPIQGQAVIPRSLLQMPDFSTLGQFDLNAISQLGIVATSLLVFSIMLSDFFDTMGSVIAIGVKANLLDKNGNFPKSEKVLLVDSLGAVAGGVMCTASNTCYIEAASGVTQGGRTGLMPVVTGILFLLAMFFTPIAGIVPAAATAPALILVGFLMLSVIHDIDFTCFYTGFPAFLTLLGMPFTYSISNGIGFGFIAYALTHLLTGRGKQVHGMVYLIAFVFSIDFMLPWIHSLLK